MLEAEGRRFERVNVSQIRPLDPLILSEGTGLPLIQNQMLIVGLSADMSLMNWVPASVHASLR